MADGGLGHAQFARGGREILMARGRFKDSDGRQGRKRAHRQIISLDNAPCRSLRWRVDRPHRYDWPGIHHIKDGNSAMSPSPAVCAPLATDPARRPLLRHAARWWAAWLNLSHVHIRHAYHQPWAETDWRGPTPD